VYLQTNLTDWLLAMGVNLEPKRNDLDSQFPDIAADFDLELNAPHSR